MYDDPSGSSVFFASYELETDTTFVLPYSYSEFDNLFRFNADLMNPNNTDGRYHWVIERLDFVVEDYLGENTLETSGEDVKDEWGRWKDEWGRCENERRRYKNEWRRCENEWRRCKNEWRRCLSGTKKLCMSSVPTKDYGLNKAPVIKGGSEDLPKGYIFSTRFECRIASSPLVSSVVSRGGCR